MDTILTYQKTDTEAVETLSEYLNCSKILATLMVNRNINTVEQAVSFLNPKLENLTDPFALKDMDKAVSRIWRAIKNNEKILIFGDFDADGVTSTCLLNDFFTHINADITWYIPHRLKEGYSLQRSHIAKAMAMNIDLIITVDCGSSSFGAVEAANDEDIDVIITDHHEVQTAIPAALAVVNPKRPDCPSGLQYLAGVGVAYYLIIALRKYLRDKGFFKDFPEPNLLNYADLVAIGTIGDMVPLKNENRILSIAGLNMMQTGSRPGIRALSDVSRINYQNIDSDDISFKIVPRINAAGRMSHARICVTQLTSPLLSSAQETAIVLDQLNMKRQQVEKDIVDGIENRILKNPSILGTKAIVLWDKFWNPSVLGIAASKLVRKYSCPVILLTTATDPAMGSGRSIDGINILEILKQCAHLLKKYGGHSMASGLSLDAKNLEAFSAAFQNQVELSSSDSDFLKTLPIDTELALDNISFDLSLEINRLRPFGIGNPEPVFVSKNISVLSSVIIGTNHRKMVLQDAANPLGQKIDAFHFNLGSLDNLPQYYSQIAYKIKINKFTMNSPQIIIEDL